MKIKVKSDAELEKLLDALASDIVDANIYYRLFSDLIAAAAEHPKEVAEAHTYWQLTIASIKEAYIIRLCRIFDQEKSTLSLTNLLDTIKANLIFF